MTSDERVWVSSMNDSLQGVCRSADDWNELVLIERVWHFLRYIDVLCSFCILVSPVKFDTGKRIT